MHKAHFMSQNISLPITLLPLVWKRADIRPMSKREFFENPENPALRYVIVPGQDVCDPFDPWELRDYFLGWRIEDWHGFFYMAGGWSSSFGITQRDFAEWQQLLREALVRPAKDWRSLNEESLKAYRPLANSLRLAGRCSIGEGSFVGFACGDDRNDSS